MKSNGGISVSVKTYSTARYRLTQKYRDKRGILAFPRLFLLKRIGKSETARVKRGGRA